MMLYQCKLGIAIVGLGSFRVVHGSSLSLEKEVLDHSEDETDISVLRSRQRSRV